MDKTGTYQPKQKDVIPVAGLQLVLHKIVWAGAGPYETKKSIFFHDVRVFCTLQQNVAPISGLITALQRIVGGIVCLLLPLHRFFGEGWRTVEPVVPCLKKKKHYNTLK